MKQIYIFILALFIGVNSYSQLSLTSTPNGVVSVSYGASGDFSLYNPGADPVVLYLWVPDTMNSQNIFYGDDWNGSLINLTWDGTAHVGTIDLNMRNFSTGGIIPTGTTVTDFMLILRHSSGAPQSADLTASTYGYSLSVLPVEDFSRISLNLYTSVDMLHISGLKSNEGYTTSIFDTMGRQIINTTSNSNQIDISALKTAVYFVTLETSEGNIIRKKIIKQ
ncbi:MAG: T9SS type A sorting domain-containing protein [Flavobacteriaceae bacterium]|nr:T9SS type A sorting domain-containing protein [Flavobacteriaceae bacterium]